MRNRSCLSCDLDAESGGRAYELAKEVRYFAFSWTPKHVLLDHGPERHEDRYLLIRQNEEFCVPFVQRDFSVLSPCNTAVSVRPSIPPAGRRGKDLTALSALGSFNNAVMLRLLSPADPRGGFLDSIGLGAILEILGRVVDCNFRPASGRGESEAPNQHSRSS